MKVVQRKKFHFDRVAFKGMSVALVGLFLVHSSKAIDPDVLPRFVAVMAFLSVCLLVGAVMAVRRKIVIDVSILRNTVSVFWLLGVVFSCASIFVAINRSEALFAGLRSAAFFVVFITLVWMMFRKAGRVNAVAAALAVLGLVLGLVGVIQLVRAVSVRGWTVHATYLVKGWAGHRNFLAQTLLVTLPFAAWGMVAARGVKRLVMAAAIIISMSLIVVLMVRSVWVAAVVAMVATGILGIIAMRKRGDIGSRGVARVAWSIGGVVIGGGLIVLAMLGSSGRAALGTRIRTLANPASGSAGGRLFIWRQTIRMVRDHPYLGVGGGNWRLVFPKYAGNRQMMRNIWKSPRRPHNDYLWILAENGPAGLLAYLAMIGTLLWWTAAETLHSRDTASVSRGLALFFAETAYVVFSAFSFPRERIGLSVVMALVFAMTVALHLSSRPGAGELGRNGVSTLVIIALVVVSAAGVIGWVRLRSETYVKSAYRDIKLGQYRQAVAELDHAVSPLYTVDRSGFPVRLYRAVAREALGREDEARHDLERACRESPYNVMALDRLALSFARLGNAGQAMLLWQKALRIHPGYQPAVHGLAVYAHEQHHP